MQYMSIILPSCYYHYHSSGYKFAHPSNFPFTPLVSSVIFFCVTNSPVRFFFFHAIPFISFDVTIPPPPQFIFNSPFPRYLHHLVLDYKLSHSNNNEAANRSACLCKTSRKTPRLLASLKS